MMQTHANEGLAIVSRGRSTLIWRSLAVWLAVTAATAAGAAAGPGAWHLVTPDAGTAQFADLLVAVCAAGLLVALSWLWLITTVTVVELATGRIRAGGGTTRRLVLLACGAAVLAGTATPALAADGDSAILAGLSLPDRSVTTSEVHHRQTPSRRTPRTVDSRPDPAPRDHVVRPGDSLWSIAEAAPGATEDVEERWREIWAANRDVIGDDPDLILPGQRLHLPEPPRPDTHRDTHPETRTDEGERR